MSWCLFCHLHPPAAAQDSQLSDYVEIWLLQDAGAFFLTETGTSASAATRIVSLSSFNFFQTKFSDCIDIFFFLALH